MNLISPPALAPARRAEGELEPLWRQHRHGLTRVAALLLDDSSIAEDVVQEAYISTDGTVTLSLSGVSGKTRQIDLLGDAPAG